MNERDRYCDGRVVRPPPLTVRAVAIGVLAIIISLGAIGWLLLGCP